MDLCCAPRPSFWRFVRRTCPLVAAGLLFPLVASAQHLEAFPDGSPTTSAPLRVRDSLVAFARAQIGVRYRYGGDSPDGGFDCSGLLKYVMSRFELNLPRTVRQQATLGVVVDRDTSQLRPGDVLLFSTREKGPVSHIGIYVGGGRFVHASSVAKRVVEVPLNRPPAPRIKRWNGVRRIPLAAEQAEAEPWPTPER